MARRPRRRRPHQQGDPGRTGELFAGAASYSTEQKLGIFRRLFRGRADVYPVRWESPRRGTSGYMPDCSNKFAPSLCNIRTTKCSRCEHRAFRPLDDDAIARHLRGQHTIGIYPLMTDDRCWFLALGFERAGSAT
jgi:hypothetical protein